MFDDDGDEVNITEWDSTNSAFVLFKGRTWQAQLAPGEQPHEGRYRIREVREGRLILEMKHG